MMKITTFSLLLLLIGWQLLPGQCTQTDFEFTTQGQIDSFQMMNPGCIEIPGKVKISGMDITNLLGLNEIKSVRSLYIQDNPILVTLNGLNNLVVVEGTWAPAGCGVFIGNNPSLPNLMGLDSLSNVEGPFTIFNNTALESLEGLELLESVGYCTVPHSTGYGGLSIENNPVLTNVNALENFSEGDIYIQGNSLLESLEGLINFGHGSLFVYENATLTSFFGLENLDSLFGSLSIGSNSNLTSFQGLDSLQYIQGGFIVQSNPLLTNFNQLANLTFIGSDCFTGGDPTFCFGLYIADNAALENLYGLDGTSLISLSILNCPNLPFCHVQSVCEYLGSGGDANISDNAPGCNSVPEVEAACGIVSVKETLMKRYESIQIAPSPVTDFFTILLPETTLESFDLQIFDTHGRLVGRQSFTPGQALQVGYLPGGFYTAKLSDGERVYIGKFFKQ